MPFRVMKFGGTSVGTPQSLTRVLEIIDHERAAGQLAVVVSAMGDTTDWLIAATEQAGAGHSADAESTVSRVEALAFENATELLRSSDASRHGPSCTALVT